MKIHLQLLFILLISFSSCITTEDTQELKKDDNSKFIYFSTTEESDLGDFIKNVQYKLKLDTKELVIVAVYEHQFDHTNKKGERLWTNDSIFVGVVDKVIPLDVILPNDDNTIDVVYSDNELFYEYVRIADQNCRLYSKAAINYKNKVKKKELIRYERSTGRRYIEYTLSLPSLTDKSIRVYEQEEGNIGGCRNL
ncbi:hypothetical protein [Flammeovirga kamogawensis]|uniref:Lipoprotein n=1 Tax=Flammeovirga kamogawensis TaxID=373891 RepID=A0ABX8GX82_9BACT|nr:hypothetical protein [Flammeovirga kamogawensis]MBB6460674.1 hypothetical protein [Flammeovirga kamogawensis]QWG08029.1 hypothetical protein KM029_03585 [Flammeovirga kamogawensis]TRX69836.1 hypothetical protein EO216_17525 [Flammeovirga kamogawensis]